MYAKSDGNMYIKNDVGVEQMIALGENGHSSWNFSTDTVGSPGSGVFRFDNTTPTSVSEMVINQINSIGGDMAPLLLTLNNGDQIYICNSDQTNCKLFDVTATPTELAGIFTILVTLENQNNVANFTDTDLIGFIWLPQTNDLQSSYDISTSPQFIISETNGGLVLKNDQTLDTSSVFKVKNKADTITVLNVTGEQVSTFGQNTHELPVADSFLVKDEFAFGLPILEATNTAVTISKPCITQDVEPSDDNTYDLGSGSKQIKDLYLSGQVLVGGDDTVPVFHPVATSYAIGENAISNVFISIDTTAIGENAGANTTGILGTTTLVGSNTGGDNPGDKTGCTYIGSNSGSDTFTSNANVTCIGANTLNDTNHSVVIGDTNVINIRSNGNCDLGTTGDPFKDIHLSGQVLVDGNDTIPLITSFGGTDVIIGGTGSGGSLGGSSSDVIIIGNDNMALRTAPTNYTVIGNNNINLTTGGSTSTIIGTSIANSSTSVNASVCIGDSIHGSNIGNVQTCVMIGSVAGGGGGGGSGDRTGCVFIGRSATSEKVGTLTNAITIGTEAINDINNTAVFGGVTLTSINPMSGNAVCDLGTSAIPFKDAYLSGSLIADTLTSTGAVPIVVNSAGMELNIGAANIPFINGIFSQLDDFTVDTVGSQTIISSNIVGTRVFSGFKLGGTLKTYVGGMYTCSVNDEIVFEFMGGVDGLTVIYTSPTINCPAAATDQEFDVQVVFTTRALGAAGVAELYLSGSFGYVSNAGNRIVGSIAGPTNANFDTTITNIFGLNVSLIDAAGGQEITSTNIVSNTLF
jgi:hypothetical protein